ncbi:MAG: hypothetical protein CM15mV60_560 [uncultured marine virus]|nr:MAG: hypothetical protein CM15mV60_560 [uncultured marine virus]
METMQKIWDKMKNFKGAKILNFNTSVEEIIRNYFTGIVFQKKNENSLNERMVLIQDLIFLKKKKKKIWEKNNIK